MPDDGITIGQLWLHRREQWDLDCDPWLCVHWRRPDSSMRVFCVWRWGLDLGPLLITRRGIRYTRQFWRWLRK